MTSDNYSHDAIAGATVFVATLVDGLLSRGEQVIFAVTMAVISSTISRLVWELWEKRKK